MVRRIFTVLANLGGGSLRKRVYVRLAAVGVLLTASIMAIAQVQRSGVAKEEDPQVEKPESQNPSQTQLTNIKDQPGVRAPHPIPSPGNENPLAAAARALAGSGTGDDAAPVIPGNDYRQSTSNYGAPATPDSASTYQNNSVNTDAPPDAGNYQRYTHGAADNPRLESDAPPSYAPTYGAYGSNINANDAGGPSADNVVTTGADAGAGNNLSNDGEGAGSRFQLSDNDDSRSASEPGAATGAAAGATNNDGTAATTDANSSSTPLSGRSGTLGTPRTAPPAVLPDYQGLANELSGRPRDADTGTGGTNTGPYNSSSNQYGTLSADPNAATSTSNNGATSNSLTTRPGSPSGIGAPTYSSGGGYGSTTPLAGSALPNVPSASVPADVEQLEGMQSPMLAIEMSKPEEVQVGREATFEIYIQNTGQVTANDVLVVDRVPAGSTLVSTTPQAQQLDGVLMWKLGSLAPGAESVLKVTVVPQVEGELVSLAQVSFAAQAAARTVSTKPVVMLEVEAAPQVLIGDWLKLAIVVRNDGTGAARGVVIEEDVPAELNHAAGRELENQIGTLRPGESRRLELTLSAEKMGQAVNTVRVRDDGNLNLIKETSIEVIAPRLEVGLNGPSRRYLQRQATYEVSVRNTGTAPARNVELITSLPAGLKFVSADKLGQYDASQHAVIWNLEELPPQKTGTVQLVTLPVEAGELVVMIEGHAELGAAHTHKHVTRVESLAELSFTITDLSDPIEVGSDTMYEIEVVNQGTKADTNVQVAAAFPQELAPLKADGPTRGVVTGQQVQFEPVPRLAPGERLVFRIQAQGQLAGDPRVLVQIRSAEAPNPVSKEESTKVYTD